MSRAPHRRGAVPSRRLRVCALAIAALLLAGELGSSIHFAVARHASCPQHGELIEIGHAKLAPPGAASEVATFVAADSSGSHRHEHCSMAPHRRPARFTAASPATTSASIAVLRPLALRTAHARGAAVLRFAPKTSPPSLS